jgi:uncharacterized protein YeaO (DUF488 family)
MIAVKRVYDPASRNDGKRVLVDRLWPRGLKREEARVDEWIKELSPSAELRKWFNHNPGRWNEFKKKFFQELNSRQEAVSRLAAMARSGKVTLLYGSRQERFNNAVALQEYISGITGKAEKKAA